ncbi:MAG: energy transducer TonB, partial [Mariniphaga sp.]|nr:energy transducer TonB [Mariniphaga sp.]
GEPLPGTSIVIKGTTVGTVTDLNGKFELEVPEKSNIVLSYVGKKTIEDSYGGITSELKSGKGYTRKYVLEDVVIEIHNKAYIGDQPPPPPPPKPAAEKVVKDVLPPPPPSQTGEQEIFYIVEDMPKYPGGFAGLEKYYTEMQQKIARSEGVKGKAKVAFTVDTNGKVTDIKVVEKDNEGVAKGAIQIVSEMPVWTPGKQRGKSVPVKYLLPLAFN